MEKEPRMWRRKYAASSCFRPGRSRQTAKAQSKLAEVEKTIMVDTEPPLPTWKLYDNPFYSSLPPFDHTLCDHHHCRYHYHHHCTECLPISARRLAASAWHRGFVHSQTSSYTSSGCRLLPCFRCEFNQARALSELDYQRRMRKKVESRNKRLAGELAAERTAREAMSRACEALAEKMERWREDRRMMRISDAWREEKARLKLAEARLIVEKRLEELCLKEPEARSTGKDQNNTMRSTHLSSSCDSSSNDGNDSANVGTMSKGRDVPESENQHIRRSGMKAVVEFRVARQVGWRGRQLGFQVECQRAQLRLVLRHKCPPPASVSMAGSDRLVV